MSLDDSLDATPAPFQTRYKAVKVLGQGSFGMVVLAEDRELRRKVAIKLVTPEKRREAQRFEREAALTARLVHPGVVRVYDFLTATDGRLVTVYEYIDGQSLEAAARQEPPPSLEQVATWGIELAEALDAAHRAGILHRDLKPANVMLRANGAAVLVDFGLGKDLVDPSALTADGYLIGTPGYMPPESWKGAPPTAAGDQFGLGATLYRVLAGRPPYELAALAAYGGGDRGLPGVRLPDPVRARDPGLADAIERAIEVLPERRFPDLAAFGRALARTVSGGASLRQRPDLGKPPASSPRSPAPRPAGLGAFVAGCALLGLAAILVLRPGEGPPPVPEPIGLEPSPGPAGPTRAELAALEDAATEALASHRDPDGRLEPTLARHMIGKLPAIIGPDPDRRARVLFRQAGAFVDTVVGDPRARTRLPTGVREAILHLAGDAWLIHRTLDRPDEVTEAIASYPPAEASEWVRRLQTSHESMGGAIDLFLDRARGRTGSLPDDLLALFTEVAGRMRRPVAADLLAEIDARLARTEGAEDPVLANAEEQALDDSGVSPAVPCSTRLAVLGRSVRRLETAEPGSTFRWHRAGRALAAIEGVVVACRVLSAAGQDELAGLLARLLAWLGSPAGDPEARQGWITGRAKSLGRQLRAFPAALGPRTAELARSLEAWLARAGG